MEWVMLIIFILLQIADVWTTIRALALGGIETNGLMRWCMRTLGRWWWIPKMAMALSAAAILMIWARNLAVIFLFFFSVFYLGVVANNWQAIRRGHGV